MRKAATSVILVLAFSFILAPMLIMNASAGGCRLPGCQLDAITNVPLADHIVRVTLNDTGPTTYNLNYTFTLRNDTFHTITILDTFFIGNSGKRYTFTGWYTYGPTGWMQWDSSPAMTVGPIFTNYTVAQCRPGPPGQNCPFVAQFTVTPPLGCRTNCNLDALTTVPAADGVVKVQDENSTVYSLGRTFSFRNGTAHTLQVLNQTFTGASSGARYIWKQWSCTCGVPSTSNRLLNTPVMYYNYTQTGKGPFLAEFDKEFQLNLAFTDQKGNALGPPSSLELVSGSTVVSLTSFSGQWESNLVWTVRNVVWEGALGIEVPGQTVDLTASSTSKTVVLRAFTATVKAVDRSNNPVANVTVTVSFANSTSRTFQTNSQGLVQLGYIPLGSYTAVVTYQGNNVCSCSTDASQVNPLVVQVPVGSTPVTVTAVSSIVLFTILGLAVFLVLLAIRVRKPPPPPSIE